MKRYTTYKNSGIDWIREIPEHWEVRKLGNLLSPISIKNHPDLPLLSITREEGIILRDVDDNTSNHNYIPDDLSNYKMIRKGQFGMNKMKAWQGSYGVSEYDGIVSPAYFIFKFSDKVDTSFFHIAIRSSLYVSFFGSASDGVRIGQWDLNRDRMKSIPFIFPPLSEQVAIAEFLDEKTGKIDEAIRIKEREIELLKERRQILIQEVVTGKKVWNPATGTWTPPERTKDSGIDWIGEIPEDWEVRKVKHILSFTKGLTITKANLQERGVKCISYGEIHSKYGFELDPEIHPLKCVSEEYLKTNPNSLLEKGNFVFADTSEDLEGSGNFTYLKTEEKVFAGYHTIIGRPIDQFEPRIIAYIFDSNKFRNQIRKKMKGVKVYSITQSILKNLLVWIPTKDEQNNMVSYLDEICKKIDDLIALKEEEIEKLKEYKTVLIDAAVTGKMKVMKNEGVKE